MIIYLQVCTDFEKTLIRQIKHMIIYLQVYTEFEKTLKF